MPAYRITKPLPEALTYRGGARYFLKVFEGLYSSWNLTLQKDAERYSAVILLSSPNKAAFDEAIATGFDVPDGGTPEKIMESLCRLGFAERLPLLRS